MKPTPEFYNFFRLQKAFLEQLNFFDPEPQVITTLNQFSTISPSLFRTIVWQGMNSQGKLTNLYHYHERYPLFIPISQVPQGPAFRIHEISWFLELWKDKNHHVPAYAPKRLSNGLRFSYTSKKLEVCFQKVSTELWLTADHNPTTVIPLTQDNFQTVIEQHVHLAHKYLLSKEIS